MKIRFDFVTNSSSSSFTCVALYSEELYNFLQHLIADEKYGEQPTWAKEQSWISPDSELYHDAIWEELSFDKRWYKVQTTEENGDPDKESINKYIKSFFKGLNPEEEMKLKELIFEVYNNEDYQVKKYKDYLDGFVGFNFNRPFNKKKQSGEERAERIPVEIAGKIFVTTGLLPEDEAIVQYGVHARGGYWKPKFVISCNYLVCNTLSDPGTTKYKKAQEQIAKGKDIRIITIDDLKAALEEIPEGGHLEESENTGFVLK